MSAIYNDNWKIYRWKLEVIFKNNSSLFSDIGRQKFIIFVIDHQFVRWNDNCQLENFLRNFDCVPDVYPDTNIVSTKY